MTKGSRLSMSDFRRPVSRHRRRGRVLIDEVLPLQLGPELWRDRRLHGAQIGEDLRPGMRADDHHRGDVGAVETKRSGSQIGAELPPRRASLSRFSMYWRGMFQDVLHLPPGRTRRFKARLGGVN
jgi:hypothetical protein